MTGFSAQVRSIIRQRAQFYCERCGSNIGTEAHHRRPRAAGGTKRPESNQPSNALWLCPGCHRDTESRRSVAYENGWLVRQHAEPVDVPVLYRGTLVYLDNLGNMHDRKPGAA